MRKKGKGGRAWQNRTEGVSDRGEMTRPCGTLLGTPMLTKRISGIPGLLPFLSLPLLFVQVKKGILHRGMGKEEKLLSIYYLS